MTVMEIPIALMAILLIALMERLTLLMETQLTVRMALPIPRMAILLMVLTVVLRLLMEIQSITLPQMIRMMMILTIISTDMDIIITKIA